MEGIWTPKVPTIRPELTTNILKSHFQELWELEYALRN